MIVSISLLAAAILAYILSIFGISSDRPAVVVTGQVLGLLVAVLSICRLVLRFS